MLKSASMLSLFARRNRAYIASLNLVALLAAFLFVDLPLASVRVAAVSPDVVISQVYGAGGNSGAVLNADYVELFNRGASPVSLGGWSIQYASATGTGNFGSTATQITELPSVDLNPGQYYLVQQASGANGAAFTADFVDPTPIAMAAGAGKVALATTTASLGCNGGASSPCSADQLALIKDLVGYGAANFSETSPTGTLSTTLAAIRKGNGCTDTDNNLLDFDVLTPAPRNSSSPLATCSISPPTPTPTPTETPTPTPTPTPEPSVFAKIAEIQGSGSVTPFAGVSVTTEGVVTAKKTNGFFMQEPDATVDADPNTSEGIFVFTSAAPAVNVGDFVNVTGNAGEFFNLTQISSNNTNVVITTSGNPLPTPIALTTTILDANGALAQLERFEGMRVSADTVVSVAPTNNFGEIWTVLDSVARPFREPGIEAGLPIPPDPTSGVPDCCIPIWDRNPERIMIDADGLAGSTRVNVTSNVTLTGIVGPLDYSFDEYKILPETTPVVASANMDAVPVRATEGSEFSVSSYNIENFTGNATRTAKASLAIRNVMNLPDVIGTIEISNLAALQALANRVNADVVAAGGTDPAYQAYLIQAPAGGSQNVGFLVKTSRVQVNNVVQEQGTRTFTNPTTGGQDILHDRPPLVLYATVNPTTDPRPIIVVVNHLRSFIDAGLVGGAGPRVREKRKVQGEATAELLQQLQTDNAGVPVISAGDYNAYQFSDGYTDPIATIKGLATNDDEVVVDGSPDLVTPDYVNLIDTLPATEQYSFIFEGTPQALDHIIVNETAASILKTFGVARMNADFTETLAGNATSPIASSDHDAPIAIFQFPQRETSTSVTDVNVVYNVNGQNIDLLATVSTTPNTVNEGTVTFTVTTLDGATTIATVGPVDVADGEATASFLLPGTVLPQELRITAEFTGGDTTLPSTGTGSLIVRYAVCTLYDDSRAVRSGAVYPIKLQLCDVNGVNVSSSGIRVTATSINLISAPDTDLEVSAAGNSNPDNNFRYDAGLAGYIFNLKTTGLASGVYRLNFTAGDDPTVHSVEFRVR